jgi:sorbitol-specific phosphotransferase system component IIC
MIKDRCMFHGINDLLDAVGLTALFTHFGIKIGAWICNIPVSNISSWVSIGAGVIAVIVGIMRGYDMYVKTKERKRQIRKDKEKDGD